MNFGKTLRLTTLATAAAILAACAASQTATGKSPLPIEVVQSGSGHVLCFQARESGDRLYVTGRAKGHHIKAHVDVLILDANGKVLAERHDKIGAHQPLPGGGSRAHDTYVASFTLGEARNARKIRVIFHNDPHIAS
jgi:hypothetical protein